MKLLICTQTVDQNDANLGFFHRWIEEFAKHCEQVTVLCLREGVHSLPRNVTVVSLGKERGGSRLMRWVRALRYIISLRHQYDSVFVHMNPEYILLGGWLWKWSGKPVVLWYVHKSVTLKLRVALHFVKSVATASKESFRLPTSKVHIVGHGIDTSLFHPESKQKSEGNARIITLGRISRSKHIDSMLEAMDRLYMQGVPFRFSIVGAPITPEDEHYVRGLTANLADKPYARATEFIGGVPYKSIPNILSQQDVFLNLSTTGSIDKAVLDALAAGVMVVTSNEAYKHSELPLIYCEPNAGSIVSAIERSLSTPQSPHVLHDAIVKKYSLSRCIERVLALYQV